MDLRPIPTPPSPEEAAVLDGVVGASPPVGLSETAARRHLLLPALHALQARVGWISPGGLGEACRRLGVPPAEGYGVASFYALFSLKPRPPVVVHVCEDVACRARGAGALLEQLDRELDHDAWHRSPCLGLCEQGPAALVQAAGEAPWAAAWGKATVEQVIAASAGVAPPPAARAEPRGELRLLRRVGKVDPRSLGDYRAAGGYRALRRALELGPAGVIREIDEARLSGRGGAAFPTGRKWAAVAAQPARPHWLVCNADESEPGTFKDRVLMEEDPYALVEAMTIAGFATGCARGILYLRAEYPLAAARMAHAIDEARAHGLLGADILGRGLDFDLEIRRGAGAYICGEETALFASIEGQRGEPRSKPPFPVEVGLFGKPTLINNVETLCNVPDIVLGGGAAFAATGSGWSTGTRLFCLSGAVARPGLYELPHGAKLSALLELAGAAEVQAVLLGGAAGSFLGPDELDLPLSLEDARKVGATLGSGVVVVFDRGVDLGDMLQRIAAFFRDESCGQCVPCRVGTVRQEELLARARRGGGWDPALYGELAQCMRDASICGLGQTASSAVESAIRRFGVPR